MEIGVARPLSNNRWKRCAGPVGSTLSTRQKFTLAGWLAHAACVVESLQ